MLVPIIEEFNAHPGTGPAQHVGADICSCFTMIKHLLVMQAWAFLRGCARHPVAGLAVPRGRTQAKARPFMLTATSRNMISLSLDNIEDIIRHHLGNGWFLFGGLLMRQIEGLPMGSGLACALTRMVLIFLDIL